jgi:hypothetical protein
MTHQRNSLGLTVALGGSVFVFGAAAQNARSPSRALQMAGNIDGIRFEGDQFHIWGWACRVGDKDSIGVRVYADHSAVDTPKGKFVFAGKANLNNEPAVDRLCGGDKGKHRFGLDIPNNALAIYRGRKLYANGVENGVEGRRGTCRLGRKGVSRSSCFSRHARNLSRAPRHLCELAAASACFHDAGRSPRSGHADQRAR